MKTEKIKLPSGINVEVFEKVNVAFILQIENSKGKNGEVDPTALIPALRKLIWSWDFTINDKAIDLTEENIELISGDDLEVLMKLLQSKMEGVSEEKKD